MPDILLAGLGVPGLSALIALSLLVGTVYGFAGFGPALIFMPMATLLVDPAMAIGAFSLSALASVFTLLPHAWKHADKRATLYLLAASVVATFPGVWVLRVSDAVALNWAVSALVLLTLLTLIAGFRYERAPGPPTWLAVGSGVGFLGGATGLNGPVLVLFQLGGQDQADRMRANTIVVLTLSSLAFLPVMAVQGAVPQGAVGLGLLLLPAYALGTLTGRRLFTPSRSGLYRTIAYLVIGAAAILGLPIWS